LFDGSGTDHVCEITDMTNDTLMFRVVEKQETKKLSKRNISLAVSLVKKDNFEWIVQKGTELGVAEFIPIISKRSEKKDVNMERATKIMIEAVEQSGRGDIPVIHEPVAFEDFISRESRGIVAFHTEGEDFSIEDISKTGDIVACVGPEGGWSESEIESFKKKGAAVVRLSSPVLRAETAAVAIATLLLLL